MSNILFATINKRKFDKAKKIVDQTEVNLERVDFDFEEIQSKSGKKIALHKVRQAYNFFKKPLIVSDDIWDIPALNGFPGSYMKEVNEWFGAEDWLNLMKDKTNRKIKLISNVVYKDEKREKFFSIESERYFISNQRKIFSNDGLLDIIALKGSRIVISEMIEQGNYFEESNDKFWRKIAKEVA